MKRWLVGLLILGAIAGLYIWFATFRLPWATADTPKMTGEQVMALVAGYLQENCQIRWSDATSGGILDRSQQLSYVCAEIAYAHYLGRGQWFVAGKGLKAEFVVAGWYYVYSDSPNVGWLYDERRNVVGFAKAPRAEER